MTLESASPMSDPLALGVEDRAWVDRQLATLSADEKIGQLFIFAAEQDTVEEVAGLAALKPGGIHRFPGHDLTNAWSATRAAIDSAETPVVISGDIEGGTISYRFSTAIPNQLGIAACDDLALTAELARIVAEESAALGYNWSFTPVIDINAAWRNPVVGTRSYGSDLGRIGDQARAYIQALQVRGVAATAKHWPGDGYDDRDQHLVTTVNPLDMESWEAGFGKLYRRVIADGVMTVMSAHIALPAFIRSLLPDAGREAFRPASVSHLLNQVLLRERLGFRGLIVSDATGMAGLTSWADREERVPAVIENGCDMFLFSRSPAEDVGLMTKGLREGRLSEARLEAAVERILAFKAKLGLHRMSTDERLPPLGTVREHLSTAANRNVAERAAGQGITLVKDRQGLLPLDPARHRRVVVIEDAGWSFFVGAQPRNLDAFKEALRVEGFEVRDFDPDHRPTREDADLIVYLAGQEATPSLGNIFLDWAKLHGGSRKAMHRFGPEIPTLMISLGQPYYLFDAPDMATYINAYCGLESVQRALVPRLLGREAFSGVSPVDPFCGLEQLQW
ncbi:glycoside hydrolase family 3 protein [Sphingomonas sp. MS122]|uniref:glycoside hydrolase family 3 protein n=1 Tax=Sphingomonas sp. MS122 TaxID=3412683 RepID=UPI003C2E6501